MFSASQTESLSPLNTTSPFPSPGGFPSIFCLQDSDYSQVVLVVKNLPANAEDARDAYSIAGSGRFPVEGSGKPLQYSCL